jgi:S1-C subfamily serine protease
MDRADEPAVPAEQDPVPALPGDPLPLSDDPLVSDDPLETFLDWGRPPAGAEPAAAPESGGDGPVPPRTRPRRTRQRRTRQRRTRQRRTRLLGTVVAVVVLVVAGVAIWRTTAGTKPQPTSKGTSTTSPPGTSSTTTTLKSLPAFSPQEIARRTDPSIVEINTVTQVLTGYALTAATGMIFSSDGYIVTNNHVVNDATTITVTVGHHKPVPATFVGADPAQDIAVLKIRPPGPLHPIAFDVSSDLSLGQSVTSIGNAHGRGRLVVTAGSITGLNKTISATDELSTMAEQLTGMIEASSAIQPGNSGGPLLDDHARVVGMNTAHDGTGSTTAFAIPANLVVDVADSIIDHHPSRGLVWGLQAFLGLAVETSGSQVRVTRIIIGDPPANAGVEPGDFIDSFDGERVTNAKELLRLVTAQKIGAAATLVFTSPFGPHTINVRLIPGPAR